jgi:excisionase family DNA binding protein
MDAPDDKLLSTRDAATLLGVGTTSVKRWADEGLLACVKTAGGHRRYARSAVLAMMDAARAAPADTLGPARASVTEPWLRLLLDGQDAREVVAALERERAALGSWWRVADALGTVVTALGQRWAAGAISVVQEHLASARLQRALVLCAESMPARADARVALLLTAANDDHTIGLHLAELVLCAAGWRCRWIGRRAPIDQVAHFVDDSRADLVAVSASSYSTDREALALQARRLLDACRARGVRLVLGGQGGWPEPAELPGAVRLHSFAELHELVAG